VDLQTICLKCLEKNPDKRYQTAGGLAEDLRRFRNRFAISARRVGPLQRLAKWARRRPAVATLVVCVLMLTLTAGFFASRSQRAEQRRRAEQRQHAIDQLDKALLLALSGHLGEAEQALKDAELLGASAGDVWLARGQIAFYRGELRAAIDHLERAVKLLPGHAAPYALLTATCSDFGYYERHYKLLAGLDALAPVSADDYLFNGLAQSSEDPKKGLMTMDESIRRRDLPMARAIRARARAFMAMATGDLSDAGLAVEDALVAKAMLRDNAFALAQSVFAHLVAAGAFDQHGRREEQRAALAQAGRDVQALDRVRHLPVAMTARGWYFLEAGDQGMALSESRSRYQSGVPTSAWEDFFFAMELYQHGEFQQSLEVFDRLVGRGGDTTLYGVCRCYVLAELREGPARAAAAYRGLTPSGVHAVYAPTVLQLLGRKAEALAAHRALREQAVDRNWPRTEWVDRWLEYNAGMISADELLAATGPSLLNRCEAHYTLGITRLAEGDRAGARDQFRRCGATHVFWFFDYHWSRAFLSRLEKDPMWPPWIPRKK
jgi:tetratricopeptide (TPR) repeat protein